MGDSAKNIIEFTLIYNQQKRKLYNYALKMLSDRLLCEDIIQNVFVKFFENMYRIRNKERTEVWLYRTLRNEIYTIYRNKHVHVDQYGVADTDDLEIESTLKLDEEIELKEMNQMMMNELDKISIEQREVFLLKEYSGFSYKEIAGIMNIDEELVKSRLYKTRQKLINRLSKVVNY